MPPSWLLEVVEDDEHANQQPEGISSVSTDSTTSTIAQTARHPNEQLKLPTRPLLPEAREIDNTAKKEKKTINSPSALDVRKTGVSDDRQHSQSGELELSAFPDLSEIDRMFSESKGSGSSSAKSFKPSKFFGGILGDVRSLGTTGGPDLERLDSGVRATSGTSSLDVKRSGIDYSPLRQQMEKLGIGKEQQSPEDIGVKSGLLSPSMSMAFGDVKDHSHNTSQSYRDEARASDDPKVLWAIIGSLLESKKETKQETTKLPSLVEMTCRVCESPTRFICGGCRLTGYCSVKHQEKDWGTHGSECRTWAKYHAGLLETQRGQKLFREKEKEKKPSSDLKPAVSSGGAKIAGADKRVRLETPPVNLQQRQNKAGTPRRAKALHYFDARYSDELSFQKGDVLNIVDMSDNSDWWSAKNFWGEVKLVPSNYFQLLPP